MRENNLIIICLITVFVGIVLMFLSNKIIKPEEFKIEDITDEQNYIEITGEITKITTSESGTKFLKLKDDTGYIDAVIFKNSINNLDKIKEGKMVSIKGRPEKYKGKMEIIVSSIH